MGRQNVPGMVIAMREQIVKERQRELVRALEFRRSNPSRAAYHTGLADGKNGVVRQLTDILNSASMSMGDNENGRVSSV